MMTKVLDMETLGDHHLCDMGHLSASLLRTLFALEIVRKPATNAEFLSRFKVADVDAEGNSGLN